ncbi:hypothetical protein Bca52824_087411 [Brassica carinata]|uniref:Uncharacterized protein n=1 Tax=Brassica carinata TaxID=52824 RepID=A0A8X7PBL3_BRACI|nr:hypothetical protein Bca52824_087411 [Brassica carinata]
MFYFVWIPCGRRTSLLIVWLDLNLSFSGDQIDYVTNLSVFCCDIHPDLHLKRFRTKETLSGVLLSRLSASASASTTAIQSLPALMIISNERIVPTPSEEIVKAVTTDPNTGLKVPFSKLFPSSTMDKIKRLSYVPAALSLKHAPSVSGVSLSTSLKRVYVVAQTNGVN